MASIEDNNMDVNVDGNKLIITIELEKRLGKSKSGKSMIVASTRGNVLVPKSETIYMGINIYEKI